MRLFRSIQGLALTFALAAGAAPAMAQEAPRAAAFKAAMVYNFARFASWRPERFPSPASPVVLCVSGDSPLAPELARMEGSPVGARKLDVRVTESLTSDCHVAFLSAGEAATAKVETLNQAGVLTVSDEPGFARAGAIGLIAVGRQVRFQVNVRAAKTARVALSAQLLSLAVEVRG